jgi:HK97 family phage major capsid protein
MTVKIADLRTQRGVVFDQFKVLAERQVLTEAERIDYTDKKRALAEFDDQITRAKEAQDLAATTATPVAGQTVAATVADDPYTKTRSLIVGAAIRMIGRSGGSLVDARDSAKTLYGESHPVTRALIVSSGTAGGFIVPPDYMNEIIELLRAQTVVRGSNPRSLPMPRGTMTLPSQTSPATATYGAESTPIAASQPALGQIVAMYRKLTALVPVSNDMMRYADPAADAFVRDDLVKVMALREDLAFLLGDQTAGTPMGYLGFANRWVVANGGTPGLFLTTSASIAAVNGADSASTTGGNFITSTYAFNLATAALELGACQNKLDTANVPDSRRVWFMSPRSKNYLFNLLNALGVYVYRDEMAQGKLLGYPWKTTTQIGNNYSDAAGHTNCSFIFLVEMDEAMILDSMQLELAVSREGSYIDSTGATVSAFQNDQTLIRAISEHDFQMRHDQAVAVLQFVAWSPSST